MDTTHSSQDINGGGQQIIKAVDEKKPRLDEKVNCPRCNSTNTKFCYYNNYSLSQPRYLCKTCKRYWTHGGSLRNVPVGGGSRKKHKKSSSKLLISPPPPHEIPKTTHHAQTLNLGSFNPSHYNRYYNNNGSSSSDLFAFGTHQHPNDLSSNFSIMEPFKTTGNNNVISSSSGFGLSSFPGSEPNSVYLPGLPVHDGLSFSLNGIENGFQDHDISASRILLPFEELKQPQHVNVSGFHEKEKEQGGLINGYNWNNGMANGNPLSW